ncbi:MAG: hypothetical protein OXC37_03805, partial [Bdellovibrionaceae bacterium]|nr:hypothetical protein [Pseudobdellovibrionaceae bacterium]
HPDCQNKLDNENFYSELRQRAEKMNAGFSFNNDKKSCKEWEIHLDNFTQSETFEDFITLPNKCKAYHEDIKKVVTKIVPVFDPNKDSANQPPANLFKKCHDQIKNAYNTCFGNSQNQRNEYQEALYLIKAKSSAVCEDEKWNKVEEARVRCMNAVQNCRLNCENIIDDFKMSFLDTFYLPDFSKNSVNAVHQNTKCKELIEGNNNIRSVFNSQAMIFLNYHGDKKHEPGAYFTALGAVATNKSTAYHITKNCSNPMEKHKIEEKITEMQSLCKKQNGTNEEQNQQTQQQNSPQLTNPTGTYNYGSNTSSPNYSQNSSDPNSVSSAFSYDKNNRLGSTDNPQQAESANSNLPNLDPSKLNDPILKKGTDSISAEFKEDLDSLSESENLGFDTSSTERGISASNNPFTKSDTDSLTKTTKTSSQTTGSTIQRTIKRILSSSADYGISDENAYAQSPTGQFVNWWDNNVKKAKKTLRVAYDKTVGISKLEFKQRMKLNDEDVNLFKLQQEMIVMACRTHNCDGTGASPEVQSQIQDQSRRIPSSQ